MSAPAAPAHLKRQATLLAWLVACFALSEAGCEFREGDPHRLIIATPWPTAVQAACEALFAAEAGHHPITWVVMGKHRWNDVCDRRGGVDLILGGPAWQIQHLAEAGRLVPIEPTDAVPWRQVQRPGGGEPIAADLDPRDDPATLAEAQAVLNSAGWPRGSALLARRPLALFPARPSLIPAVPPLLPESVALVRGGRHPDQAERFLVALTRQGWIVPAPTDAAEQARTEDLLADLLGAALIDARNERRDAQMALAAFNHPDLAEAAVGELPPWPPASVFKLQADPTRTALAAALLEQVTPDPLARLWLAKSWHQPRRRLAGDLLGQIAAAEGGRLAREPRFRAWLRGEWTAWTQQLYRRVARLAGGYRPS